LKEASLTVAERIFKDTLVADLMRPRQFFRRDVIRCRPIRTIQNKNAKCRCLVFVGIHQLFGINSGLVFAFIDEEVCPSRSQSRLYVKDFSLTGPAAKLAWL
jgi:hypothetical protein